MIYLQRMMKPLHVLLLISLSLCGCATTMAPNYAQPVAPVPAVWPEGPAYRTGTDGASERNATDIPWREFFISEQLRQLIDLALKNNRDLRIAALNIEKARAQYQVRRATLMPAVDASAGANLQRTPEDFSSSGRATTVEQYNVGLGISSYELDLFGRVRSLKDQALEQFLATEQAQLTVRISLISQIAASYLALAADRERLQLAKKTLVNQQDSFKLIKSRFDAGVVSSLTVNQAQTAVDAAKVDIARYTTLVAQDENALALVVGASVPPELLPPLISDILTSLKDISPGLQSEVLLCRPDILQAESQLKGANANIGAARATFFPRITLVSSIGFGSDDLALLFKPGSFAWKFAPQITLPIFDGGSNLANLKSAETDRDITLAQYEKAIQNAFREVADALAQKGTVDDQLAAQQSLVNATYESYRLSQARHEKGVDSYLNVLDSQRALYAAQQNLITNRLSRLTNLVTLYKALGGGQR